MEDTKSSEKIPRSLGMDSQGSSILKFELSEYGNDVPFKVIKLEQDEVPDMFPEAITRQRHAGISKHPQDSTSSEPLDNPASTSFCDVYNELQQIHSVKKEMTDDEYDIDMGFDNDCETDSECELFSDFDYPLERRNGGEANGPHVLDDADGDTEIPCRPPTPKWSLKPKPHKQRKLTKKQEIRIVPPKTPYDAFRLFLNDEIIETIVQETNKYAAQICSHPLIGLKSRFRSWQDVTPEEMIIFLGLLIHTGTFRSNRLRDYWNQDYLFNWPCFSKYMNQRRFMAILSCLSFASSTDSRDVVGKIRPIIQNFNTKMSEIYYPGKRLFLANPLVVQRDGRLVRQKHRHHDRRTDVIKIHTLAEQDGTIIKYEAYYNNIDHNFITLTTGDIVKELLKNYLGNGHIILMNKCYSSWKLAVDLMRSQTYCTGILSKKSKDIPSACKLNNSNQTFFMKGVQIGKWDNDESVIFYISTERSYSSSQFINKYGLKRSIPTVISQYCKSMTDLELQDQLTTYNPCSRKYLRWDKKVFLHSLQIYMRSAFRLYNNFSGKKKLYIYNFRLEVLRAMLPELKDSPPLVPVPHKLTKIAMSIVRRRKYKSDNSVRMTIESSRKKCQRCRLVKKLKNVMTTFECLGCEGGPALCPNCFDEVHSNLPEQKIKTDSD